MTIKKAILVQQCSGAINQGVQWGMGGEEIQARRTYQSFMKSGGGKSYGAIGRRCSEPQMQCLSRGNRWKELVPKENKRCGK